MVLKLGVIGAAGRMGKELLRVILESAEFELVAAIESESSPYLGASAGSIVGLSKSSCVILSDLNTLLEKADVGIDFVNNPDVIVEHCKLFAEHLKPIVVGTTGIKKEDIERIKRDYARYIPILISSNMSFGMNILFSIVGELAKKLIDYDVEIIEMHHSAKLDAPSGTALRIFDLIKESKGREGIEVIPVYGREGKVSRKKQEIGIFALRGGDVVGEHTVLFTGLGERLELIHRVYSRRAFAEGAVRAAKWIISQPPGLYHSVLEF